MGPFVEDWKGLFDDVLGDCLSRAKGASLSEGADSVGGVSGVYDSDAAAEWMDNRA